MNKNLVQYLLHSSASPWVIFVRLSLGLVFMFATSTVMVSGVLCTNPEQTGRC